MIQSFARGRESRVTLWIYAACFGNSRTPISVIRDSDFSNYGVQTFRTSDNETRGGTKVSVRAVWIGRMMFELACGSLRAWRTLAAMHRRAASSY